MARRDEMWRKRAALAVLLSVIVSACGVGGVVQVTLTSTGTVLGVTRLVARVVDIATSRTSQDIEIVIPAPVAISAVAEKTFNLRFEDKRSRAIRVEVDAYAGAEKVASGAGEGRLESGGLGRITVVLPGGGVPQDMTAPADLTTCVLSLPAPSCPTGTDCSGLEWAQWPMPNPASSGLPNPARYTVLGAAGCFVVRDEVTGLYWQQEVPAGPYTWQQSKDYCAALNLGGTTGWRLPYVIELNSLVDFTKVTPAINSTYFPNTPSSYFWSSSAYAGSAGNGWGVNFNGGGTVANDVSDTNRVRCVR